MIESNIGCALVERLGFSVNIYLAIVLMLFGLALHLAKKMVEFEDAGTAMSPISYAKQHPWRIFLTVGSCVGLIFMLSWMNQLNEFAAFSTGITGSSAFDALRSRANSRLDIGESKK